MAKIFLSAQNSKDSITQAILRQLKGAGHELVVSPADDKDPRWADWTQGGMQQALEGCEIFVVVVNDYWEGAPVPTFEAFQGYLAKKAGKVKRMCFWNPKKIAVRSAGMKAYLTDPLPDRIEDVPAAVVAEPKNP
jgi:hypothetical protein